MPAASDNVLEYPVLVPDNLAAEEERNHEKDDQMSFVRKVLGIVTAQMTLTFSMAVASSKYPEFGRFMRDPMLLTLSITAGIMSMIVLFCSKHARMSVPLNYGLLFVFTWMESMIVAETTATLEVESVLTCIAAFCTVTGCLFGAAIFTKSKSKLMVGFSIGILASILIQLAFTMTMWILGRNSYIVAGWATVGVLCSGLYIVGDLMMIMDSRRIGYDDYILGALTLYVDMIRMFMYILALFAKKK